MFCIHAFSVVCRELLKGGGFSVMFVCPPSALNDDMISLLLQQQNRERELQIKHFAEFNTRNQSLKVNQNNVLTEIFN